MTRSRLWFLTWALCGLLAIAGGLRFIYTFSGARLDGDFVQSLDADPYYHLHRLEYSAANGGRPLIEDRFAAAPSRFLCTWPVALDYLALGLDAAVYHGERARDTLLLSAGILPVLCGVLMVLLTFLVLLHGTSGGAALLGAAYMAAAWEGLSITAFGMFDHHCLEQLCWVALPAAGALAMGQRGEGRRPGIRALCLGALSFGPAILCGDAAYLIIMVGIGVAALLCVLARLGRVSAQEGALFGAFACGALLGVAGASTLEIVAGLPRALSQAGRLGLMLSLAGLGLSIGRRGRWLAATLGLCALGVALALPTVIQGVGYLTASGDPISPTIVQSQPLWKVAPVLVPRVVALTALALVLAVLRRGVTGDFLLMAAAVGGGVMGLVQVKYLFLVSWTGAWAIAQGAHLLGSYASGWRRPALRVALAAGMLVFLLVRTRTEIRSAPAGVLPRDAAFARLARSIEQRTPPQEPLRRGAVPSWSIALDPDLGPRTLHLARRAVTAVPFWSTPEQLRQYQLTLRALVARDEGVAVAALQELQARYVLVYDLGAALPNMVGAAQSKDYPAGAASSGAAYAEALSSRLYRSRGSATQQGLQALGHFRLVAEEPAGDTAYRFFERVPGASLSGTAPADSLVVFTARIQSLDGAVFPWSTRSTADSAGHFTLTVPYATEPSLTSAHASAAILRCAGGDTPVVIPEQAVANSLEIPVACR